MLSYFLGCKNKEIHVDSTDKFNTNFKDFIINSKNTDADVIDISDYLTKLANFDRHGGFIREGFKILSNNTVKYYFSINWDLPNNTEGDSTAVSQSSVRAINLQDEHVLSLDVNGRTFSENPRYVRLYRQEVRPTDQDIQDKSDLKLEFVGIYGLTNSGKVKSVSNTFNGISWSQYDILDVVMDINKNEDLSEQIIKQVNDSIKYSIVDRDVDLSIVIDLSNRYSGNFFPASSGTFHNVPFLQSYNGTVRVQLSDKVSHDIYTRLTQVDFIAQTALLATNNDVMLKERR